MAGALAARLPSTLRKSAQTAFCLQAAEQWLASLHVVSNRKPHVAQARFFCRRLSRRTRCAHRLEQVNSGRCGFQGSRRFRSGASIDMPQPLHVIACVAFARSSTVTQASQTGASAREPTPVPSRTSDPGPSVSVMTSVVLAPGADHQEAMRAFGDFHSPLRFPRPCRRVPARSRVCA